MSKNAYWLMKLMRYDDVSNEHWHAVWNSNEWEIIENP
jgi:hypothetical protein